MQTLAFFVENFLGLQWPVRAQFIRRITALQMIYVNEINITFGSHSITCALKTEMNQIHFVMMRFSPACLRSLNAVNKNIILQISRFNQLDVRMASASHKSNASVNQVN